MSQTIRQKTCRLALTVMAGAMIVPAASAQPACRAGALSAYLTSAGLGCTVGNLRMRQFASTSAASLADQLMITPFTLQGPPGYTWVGFTVRFGAGLGALSPSSLDFSFWSDGAPLFGLMADIDPAGSAGGINGVGGRLIGEGGTFRVRNSTPGGDVWGCGILGSSPESCRRGAAEYRSLLADSDGSYLVQANTMIRGRTGSDFTVAVLTSNAIAAPEPATLLLLSSGLGGVGAMLRRRRRR